jgi:hypothetical protein
MDIMVRPLDGLPSSRISIYDGDVVLLCRPRTLPSCMQHGCWALSARPALPLRFLRHEPMACAQTCDRADCQVQLSPAA